MQALRLSVVLSPGYQNQFVDIHKTNTEFNFKLKNGRHTVKTSPIEIGQLHYFNKSSLQAQLSFTYEFDEANKTLTLCGSHYSTKDSMCLTTFPKDSNEYCHQRCSSFTIDDEHNMYNTNWNYHTSMTPGLEALLAEIVRNANDALLKAAQGLQGVIVRVKTPPPALASEEYAKMLLVYQDKKLKGMYEAGVDYGADYVVLSVESVWAGTVTFSPGENFANVIGSTNDPKIAGLSWIRLWENQFGQATTCTSLNYNGFTCNVPSGLVGGHVILGTVAKSMPKGSDVYIMPICTAHNNNDNVYMAALQYYNGIWLKNYLGS